MQCDTQVRRAAALQLALAIREEVADLEKAGIRVIQAFGLEGAQIERFPGKERFRLDGLGLIGQ